MILAERRRKIYDWTLQNGSVSVTWLAERLGVGLNTIRNDLAALEKEGKLMRSHGGAIIRDSAVGIRMPYSQTRNTNLAEKALIGQKALEYLPETGTIFLGPGTTCHQLAIRVPKTHQLHIITISPQIASFLASQTDNTVDILGGRVRKDSDETDVSLSEDSLDTLYWDIAFFGVSAIDPVRGITSLDQPTARYERRILEQAARVIVLCDSSKIGKLSYARVGPVTLMDILITDSKLNPDIAADLEGQGIKIVYADEASGPTGREG